MALVLPLKCFLPTGSSQPNSPYCGYASSQRSGLCLGIGLIIINLLSFRIYSAQLALRSRIIQKSRIIREVQSNTGIIIFIQHSLWLYYMIMKSSFGNESTASGLSYSFCLIQLQNYSFLMQLLAVMFDGSNTPHYSFRTLQIAFQLFYTTHHLRCYLQYSSEIFELAAVIRCREDSYQRSAVEKLVSFLYNLMGSADEIEGMLFQELIDNARSVHNADSPLKIVLPTDSLWVRIRPQQVTQKTIFSRVYWSLYLVYLIQVFEKWAQSSMHAEDAITHHCCNRKVLKGTCDNFEYLHIEFLFALIIKPVNLIKLTALMVSSQQEEVQRVLDFHRHQQAITFQRFLTSIHVVSEKEVAAFRRITNTLEDRKEICILAMRVSADDQWRVEFQQHWLAHCD